MERLTERVEESVNSTNSASGALQEIVTAVLSANSQIVEISSVTRADERELVSGHPLHRRDHQIGRPEPAGDADDDAPLRSGRQSLLRDLLDLAAERFVGRSAHLRKQRSHRRRPTDARFGRTDERFANRIDGRLGQFKVSETRHGGSHAYENELARTPVGHDRRRDPALFRHQHRRGAIRASTRPARQGQAQVTNGAGAFGGYWDSRKDQISLLVAQDAVADALRKALRPHNAEGLQDQLSNIARTSGLSFLTIVDANGQRGRPRQRAERRLARDAIRTSRAR